MSLTNLYSGFKFLGESLLNPTKALFQAKEEAAKPQNHQKKDSISTASSPHYYSKTEYSPERDLWDEASETPDWLKPKGHKARQERQSTSSNTPVTPFKKPSHNHTKSLLTLVGGDGIDSIKLHDGKIEALQSTEAPLLFAKGGYDSHVTTKNVKPQHMPKNSMSQTKRKGGFLILEKDEESERDDVFDPLGISTPVTSTRQSMHGSQTCKPTKTNESFSSFAKKADMTPKANVTPRIIAKDPKGNEIIDPLSGSMSPSPSKGKLGKNLRRVDTASSTNLSDHFLRDPLFDEVRFSGTRDRQPLSPFMQDTFSQSISEKPSSHVRNGTNSYFNNTPSHSRMSSIVIMEDITSDLEIDLEDDLEVRSSFCGSREKFNEYEVQFDSSRTNLVEEYKTVQKQQLYTKGIYLVPTSSHLIWSCLVFIKGGYYEKGKFKFQIHFSSDYPSGSMRVYSLTKIYHPLINIETGELDLKLYEQNGENKVSRLGEFIKSIFNESKYLEKVSSFNQEAGTKFTQNPNYFKLKAKESVRLSQKNTLNENTESAHNIPENINSVREMLKDVAKSQIKFDDKVQMLIQNITKNVSKAQ